MNGFIKIHRQLLDWEWYTDTNVKSLFLHCLLSANFKQKKWRGKTIKRGQFVTSLNHLSRDTGLSVRNIRTALDKLEGTGEIKRATTQTFTILTVVKFDTFQCFEEKSDTQSTKKRQTKDKQSTTTEEGKKDKNERNKKDIINNIQKPDNFDDELFAIFMDFLEMRKGIKKAFKTENSIKTRINTLSKDVDRYGIDAVKAAVTDTIANEYQGIFVKKFADVKDYQKTTPPNYTPIYSIPPNLDKQQRYFYFMARYEAYKPYLREYDINTSYRKKAILEQNAEGLCYELEQQNPKLAQIQVNFSA